VALGLIPANVPGAFRAPRPPDDFDPRTASRAALARYGLPWRSARRGIRLRSGRCGSARWPRRGWPAAGWSCGLCRGPGWPMSAGARGSVPTTRWAAADGPGEYWS